MTEEPDIIRQWRAERRGERRRVQWVKKLSRGIWLCVAGIFAVGVVVGAILGTMMIVRDFSPPFPPGTFSLGKVTPLDDGLFLIEIRAQFGSAPECLAAKEIMPASERIMYECVAR